MKIQLARRSNVDPGSFAFYLLLAMVLFALAGGVAGEERMIPEWAQKALKEAQTNEVPIEFYGRVVDQFGDPVEDAEVHAHLQRVGINYVWEAPLVSYAVRTDAHGLFVIPPTGTKAVRGLSLTFDNIRKEGYEAVHGEMFLQCYAYVKNGKREFSPDKARPIVFHVRKKGADQSFLLQTIDADVCFMAEESGLVKGYDLIRKHRIKDTRNLVYDGEPLFPDIQVKATFNTNNATWTVVLSPSNTNGGIIVSEQLLYEAPETGYQPEYTFTPEDRKPVKAKYIYLKSRDPAIYTRYEIEYVNADKEFFQLSGKSVTNPYGDRNLEQSTDLSYEVTKQLTDDAKTAFRQNKRPLKPDLPKLVKEAKEKTEKDKGKQ